MRTLEQIQEDPYHEPRVLQIRKSDLEQWRQILTLGKKQLTKSLKIAIAKDIELS